MNPNWPPNRLPLLNCALPCSPESQPSYWERLNCHTEDPQILQYEDEERGPSPPAGSRAAKEMAAWLDEQAADQEGSEERCKLPWAREVR